MSLIQQYLTRRHSHHTRNKTNSLPLSPPPRCLRLLPLLTFPFTPCLLLPCYTPVLSSGFTKARRAEVGRYQIIRGVLFL